MERCACGGGMMTKERYVYLFQTGRFYDTPDIVKAFSNLARALKAVPKTFKEKHEIGSYYYSHYFENKRSRKWLTIKKMKLE
jgi:hypothetical protein